MQPPAKSEAPRGRGASGSRHHLKVASSQTALASVADPGADPPSQPPPWSAVEACVPAGFELRPDGLWRVTADSNRTKIADPVWVMARTQTLDQVPPAWGVLLGWIDHDGCEQEEAFPAHLLHGREELAKTLALRGLAVTAGREKLLLQYLSSMQVPERQPAVSRLGWLDREELRYVLPDLVVGGNDERMLLQLEHGAAPRAGAPASGTLENWKSDVAKLCRGNPLPTFALGQAFVGPMLRFVEDSGGFHFYGPSSIGKTTLLQVAASVWGSGASPSETSSIERWNSTVNAFESLAASRNDGLLCLDEIQSCDADDFGRVVYNLAGGVGKKRLNKDSRPMPTRAWRVSLLSSGESSSKEKIEEGYGNRRRAAKEGQLARLVDVHVENSVVRQPHGMDSKRFVERLQQACGRYYGVAGEAFLEAFIHDYKTVAAARRELQVRLQSIETQLAEELGRLDNAQRRALKRFALVHLALQLAMEFGVVPFEAEEIDAAVMEVIGLWRRLSSQMSQAERGLVAVRDSILAHPARFRLADEDEEKILNLMGYRDPVRALYLFTEDGFKEACQGNDVRDVRRELARRGLLFRNDSDRVKSKHSIAGFAERLNLYAVKEKLLGEVDAGGD